MAVCKRKLNPFSWQTYKISDISVYIWVPTASHVAGKASAGKVYVYRWWCYCFRCCCSSCCCSTEGISLVGNFKLNEWRQSLWSIGWLIVWLPYQNTICRSSVRGKVKWRKVFEMTIKNITDVHMYITIFVCRYMCTLGYTHRGY